MPEHSPAPTPSRAVYGFVMYLSFQLFFFLYLIWALVPGEYFESLGITFLPQRSWAVSIPIFLLTVLTVFAFGIYPALGLIMTPNMDDTKTIKDRMGDESRRNGKNLNASVGQGSECVCLDEEKCRMEYFKVVQSTTVDKSIPKLKDLDIWDVSESLYLK